MSLYIHIAAPPYRPPPPPVSNANCYDHATGDVVTATDAAQLEARVNGAPSGGRQVLMAPGIYSGGTLTFTRAGDAPVVVRPRDGAGTVTFTNPTWTFAPGSSRIVLAGIQLTNPGLAVNGDHHRLTRCRMNDLNRFAVHVFAAAEIRVDHCDVVESRSSASRKAFVRLDAAAVARGACKRILVDYNHCHDSLPAEGANGSDYIGLHSDDGCSADPELVIDHCLFERIALPQEGELIGGKASGIIFRYCTVLDMPQPYINAPRTAGRFEVRSSWFERCNANIVHLCSTDSLLIGNRFVGGVSAWLGAGDYYWDGAPVKGYPAADCCRAIGNRMDSGRIKVGGFWSGVTPSIPARDCNLWGNTRDAGGAAHELVPDRHVGTTFDRDDEPYEPAVKLTPADVGIGAADPLCQTRS